MKLAVWILAEKKEEKKKRKQAFAVAVKAAPRCQTVDACQSTENKVLQLSYLIDHAALSKLLLSHFYITALIEKLSAVPTSIKHINKRDKVLEATC